MENLHKVKVYNNHVSRNTYINGSQRDLNTYGHQHDLQQLREKQPRCPSWIKRNIYTYTKALFNLERNIKAYIYIIPSEMSQLQKIPLS